MEKKIIRALNFAYYGCMSLAVAMAVLCYLLVKNEIISVVDPQSQIGQIIQYCIIAYIFVTVPSMLYLFKRKCEQYKLEKDDAVRLSQYKKFSFVRIIVIGVGISFGVAAFYLLGGYTSMIWTASIAAIGLYFCKPTLRKMEIELLVPQVDDGGEDSSTNKDINTEKHA